MYPEILGLMNACPDETARKYLGKAARRMATLETEHAMKEPRDPVPVVALCPAFGESPIQLTVAEGDMLLDARDKGAVVPRIATIKEVCSRLGAGLREAKMAVDAFCHAHNIRF
jgi:ribosomal protein L7/L12